MKTKYLEALRWLLEGWENWEEMAGVTRERVLEAVEREIERNNREAARVFAHRLVKNPKMKWRRF